MRRVPQTTVVGPNLPPRSRPFQGSSKVVIDSSVAGGAISAFFVVLLVDPRISGIPLKRPVYPRRYRGRPAAPLRPRPPVGYPTVAVSIRTEVHVTCCLCDWDSPPNSLSPRQYQYSCQEKVIPYPPYYSHSNPPLYPHRIAEGVSYCGEFEIMVPEWLPHSRQERVPASFSGQLLSTVGSALEPLPGTVFHSSRAQSVPLYHSSCP